MKQILVIGDVHGKSDWIKYAEEAFKAGIDVVFLGDYVDSFDIKPNEISQNLLRIIAFKRKSDARKVLKNNVTLLLGNHDYAYVAGKSQTSGYNSLFSENYRMIFNQNWDLFKVAWGHQEGINYTLATHAGLTKTFWNNYILNPNLEHYDFVKSILGENAFEITPIHVILNLLKDKFSLIWKVGSDRGGAGTPGFLWADIRELKEDPCIGINQIVGHTGWHSPELIMTSHKNFILKIDGVGNETQRSIVTL